MYAQVVFITEIFGMELKNNLTSGQLQIGVQSSVKR